MIDILILLYYMGEFARFIPEMFKKQPESPAQNETVVDNKFYDHLVGVWPDMMHAIINDMKQNGASFSETRQAKKLMMENRDRIFLEAVRQFQAEGGESKDKPLEWIKEEERIAYQKFRLLLKRENLREARKNILQSYLDGGLKRETDASVSEDSTEEDLRALRGIIPPERYQELVNKKRAESAAIANLPKEEQEDASADTDLKRAA